MHRGSAASHMARTSSPVGPQLSHDEKIVRLQLDVIVKLGELDRLDLVLGPVAVIGQGAGILAVQHPPRQHHLQEAEGGGRPQEQVL